MTLVIVSYKLHLINVHLFRSLHVISQKDWYSSFLGGETNIWCLWPAIPSFGSSHCQCDSYIQMVNAGIANLMIINDQYRHWCNGCYGGRCRWLGSLLAWSAMGFWVSRGVSLLLPLNSIRLISIK